MPEETKCPKCGAEVIKNFSDFKEFSCRSQWGSATGFIQTTICERRVEISTLRAALSKAKDALEKIRDYPVAFEPMGCLMGIQDIAIATLSTLTRAENGDL